MKNIDSDTQKLIKGSLIALVIIVIFIFFIGLPSKENFAKNESDQIERERNKTELQAKKNAFYDCQKKYKYSDSERTTAALVTEVEFQRMGKSYLLEGKSIGEKVDIFCEAKSGYSQH